MTNEASAYVRVRLLVGAAQGAALYVLQQGLQSRAGLFGEPLVLSPLLMLAVFLPLLASSGLGYVRLRALGWWLALAALLVGALACYDIWRTGATGLRYGAGVVVPSFQAWFFIAAALFMAHVLVLASAHDGRRIATYATYFDLAWTLGIQHVFSAAFLGGLWLVLWLGAALFNLVGLKFLQRLLLEAWFAIPLSTLAVAWALHLTDVKPEIVRGIRALMLVLLSWILPVIVLVTAGFLGSLLLTGLAPLWATRHAMVVLMITAATIIVLINAAYQSGEGAERISKVVRLSGSLGALLLMPLVGLAVHALELRVSQYGWTADRVVAAAGLIVGAWYAIGYAVAALRSQAGWLGGVAPVNIGATWLVLIVLLALFSPAADPARLAVSDQVGRLRHGLVAPESFDYTYLRFDAGRWGEAMLAAMVDQRAGMPEATAPVVARLAREAQEMSDRSGELKLGPALGSDAIRRNMTAVWPAGRALPESFVQQAWRTNEDRSISWSLPECLSEPGVACEAVLLQLDEDEGTEVLLIQESPSPKAVLFDQDATGQWRIVSVLPDDLVECEEARERLRRGQFRYVPPRYKDLRLGDWVIEVLPENGWRFQFGTTDDGGCKRAMLP